MSNNYYEALTKKVKAATAPLQLKINEMQVQIKKVEAQLSTEVNNAAKLQERAAKHKATAGEQISENPEAFKKSLKELRSSLEDSEAIVTGLRDNFLPSLKTKLFAARQEKNSTVENVLVANRPSFCESTIKPLVCQVLDSLKNLTDEREVYGETVERIYSEFGLTWDIGFGPLKRSTKYAPKIPVDEIANLQKLLTKAMSNE